MTRISQLIAVAQGVKADTEARVDQLIKISRNGDLFKGHERTYRPKADDGVQLPPESLKVRSNAEELLLLARTLLSREYDLVRTLDEANASAAADVTVDGKVLLPKVPVGHLLWLARELDRLHLLVSSLPETDQARSWTNAGHGLVGTDPVETVRTEKIPFNHVLYEATQQHPAQVQLMNRDETVGYWSTVTFSGAVSRERKQELLDRVSRLRDAVKQAREEANTAEAPDRHEGKVLFDWLLR